MLLRHFFSLEFKPRGLIFGLKGSSGIKFGKYTCQSQLQFILLRRTFVVVVHSGRRSALAQPSPHPSVPTLSAHSQLSSLAAPKTKLRPDLIPVQGLKCVGFFTLSVRLSNGLFPSLQPLQRSLANVRGPNSSKHFVVFLLSNSSTYDWREGVESMELSKCTRFFPTIPSDVFSLRCIFVRRLQLDSP